MSNNHHLPDLALIRSVTEAGFRGDRDLVMSAVSHDDPAVRRASIGACARLELLDQPLMQRFLTDSDPAVRHRAVELSARMEPDPDLLRLLIGVLDDQAEIAEVGAFALGELEQPTPDVVESLARMARTHEDALCREAAVAALGALHADLPTILSALGDKAAVRRRAVIALAPFDGPDVDAALELATKDRDWQVRQVAEDLLPQPPGPAA